MHFIKIMKKIESWVSKVWDKNSADKNIRRTKVPKFRVSAENFVRRKFLSAENFVRRNILSAEIQSISNQYQIHVRTYFSCKVYEEIRNS